MGFQVVFTSLFRKEYRRFLECSDGVYSQQTLNSLVSNICNYQIESQSNPFIGAIEPMLCENGTEFRHIVIRPYFKLIYFVDKNNVVLTDIWDTRRNPDVLKERVTQSF